MAKVTNLTGKAIPLLRYTIYPDGRIDDNAGNISDELPPGIEYCAQAQRLIAIGVISIAGLEHLVPTEKITEPDKQEITAETGAAPTEVTDEITEELGDVFASVKSKRNKKISKKSEE